MRLCPTVEGTPSPLITHRIAVSVCQARQGTHFHKCHKCIYRGKAADWEKYFMEIWERSEPDLELKRLFL